MSKLKKGFIIENFGCQMNQSDTEEVLHSLIRDGFFLAKDKSSPDIIIINSCAVRETAEQRVYSHLKYYYFNKYKDKRPIFILMGCVAQKEKENVLEKMPWINLVIGTHEKSRLSDIVSNYIETNYLNSNNIDREGEVYSDFGLYKFEDAHPSTKYPFKAEMSIIHGCNKFCSYCIVPYTRGEEISRSSEAILENTKALVADGVSEIMLLGQNVNSYGQDINDISFPELLFKLNNLDNGLKRIRFLTSHPIDFNDKLIEVMKDCKKICKYVHLPLQSASNTVLQQMKREYTFEHYLSIIHKLRKAIPSIVLSTDILVGFPYETEGDFIQTLEAIKLIRYDTAYMFKYSNRSGTIASNYPQNIDDLEKQRRLKEIIETQSLITKEQNKKDIGKIEEILLESRSKNNPNELLGKTNGNKNVVTPYDITGLGQYKTVSLDTLKGNTFYGTVLEDTHKLEYH